MASLGRGALVGAALASTAGLALSAEATARLSWVRLPGAESCADASTIRAKVKARLGRDPFSETAPQSIEGTVAREGTRWVARLYVRDAETGALRGQRELMSDDAACAALDPGVTLAIALAIDPEGALSPAPSASPSVSTSVSAPAMPSASVSVSITAAVPPAASPPPVDPPVVVVHAVAGAGLVPQLGPGVALSFEPHQRGLHPWFGAALVPAQRTRDQEIVIGLATLRAGACGPLATDPHVKLLLCGAVDGGVVTTAALTLPPDAPGDRLFFAGTASLRIRFLVGPLVLEAFGEVSAPFRRHRFTKGAEIGRPEELFQQWRVAPRLGLGVGF